MKLDWRLIDDDGLHAAEVPTGYLLWDVAHGHTHIRDVDHLWDLDDDAAEPEAATIGEPGPPIGTWAWAETAMGYGLATRRRCWPGAMTLTGCGVEHRLWLRAQNATPYAVTPDDINATDWRLAPS